MALKHWQIRPPKEAEAAILSEECGIGRFTAEILAARGFDTPAAAGQFLAPAAQEESAAMESPFILADMDKAVERIRRAIDEGELIAIYGDYDCDGVTSTVMLWSYLSSAGAEVTTYIPERETEGYGLNKAAIQMLADHGIQLIITVDNGIASIEEAEFTYSLGLELVITDHHQPGENLPRAEAVVDPHRHDCPSTFKDLCGAGVALKLIAALEDGDMDAALEYVADLAAIGTIGDVMPLVGENRTIVRRGLPVIEAGNNIGVAALIEASGLSGKTLRAENVAFGLVPRINAAGRLGSARTAVELLTSEDEETAAALASQVDGMNRERQRLETDIMKEITARIESDNRLLLDRVLVLEGKGWHHGVVGIVASRVVERFGKPAILLSVGEDGYATGSGRSIGEFSLFHALQFCGELMVRYGGHKAAAGMTLEVEKIEEFRIALNRYAAAEYDEMPPFTYTIDKILRSGECTVENVAGLSSLEPFGTGCQTPLFLLEDVRIDGIFPLSENKHIRLKLTAGNAQYAALWFGMSPDRFPFREGDKVDAVVTLELNHFKGSTTVSMKMKDLRPHGFREKPYFSAKHAYERLGRGEEVDPRLLPRMVPSRDDAARVYQILRRMPQEGREVDTLYEAIAASGLNYCKYRVILDVLAELGLLSIAGTLENISLVKNPPKVDFQQSLLLQRLQSMCKQSVEN